MWKEGKGGLQLGKRGEETTHERGYKLSSFRISRGAGAGGKGGDQEVRRRALGSRAAAFAMR